MTDLTRRVCLFGLMAWPLAMRTVWTEAPIDLDWLDLVLEDQGTKMARLRTLGIVQHGQLSTRPRDRYRNHNRIR